ncbi:hypothetical protein [Dactylosporangium sp. CA-092794]|uniref:hypothetical protein n=1 Tax=Dactylosporangium sp. CA-092794 TaxID=3239929 RepID=UPI003D946672
MTRFDAVQRDGGEVGAATADVHVDGGVTRSGRLTDFAPPAGSRANYTGVVVDLVFAQVKGRVSLAA